MSEGQIDCGRLTTRKPHRCAYCGLDIPAGTEVFWWTRVDDGRIYRSRAHLECQAAYDWERREFGLTDDELLPDAAEFRSEVLAGYRHAVASGEVGGG